MTISIPVASEQPKIAYNFIPDTKREIKQHKFVRAEFDALLDKFSGVGRGEGYAAYTKGSVLIYSLAEMFARRVGGKHNKNVIFILFGDLGGGKSMTLMKLAVSCAQWLAAIRGGKPSDYFTMKNIAVIDPEMLQEKMGNLRQYEILILDDAGPGYDARTFMSKQNRDLNYILQTCRTTNNIILVSAPHGAMLDVTIHRVAQYYGEISEIRHDEGLTFLKVFRLIRVFREGKIFYVYMTKSGVSIRRYYATLPPKELKKEYDKIRDTQAKIIQNRRAQREQDEREKKECISGPRKGPHPQALNILPEKLKKIRDMCMTNPHTQVTDILAVAGCHHSNIGKVLKSAGIRNVGTKIKKNWEVDALWGSIE
jgi:hypothetical protein